MIVRNVGLRSGEAETAISHSGGQGRVDVLSETDAEEGEAEEQEQEQEEKREYRQRGKQWAAAGVSIENGFKGCERKYNVSVAEDSVGVRKECGKSVYLRKERSERASGGEYSVGSSGC